MLTVRVSSDVNVVGVSSIEHHCANTHRCAACCCQCCVVCVRVFVVTTGSLIHVTRTDGTIEVTFGIWTRGGGKGTMY